MKFVPWVLSAVALLVIARWVSPSNVAAGATSVAASMPKGKGKDETLRYCSGCHTMDVIVKQHKSKQRWLETVQVMAQKGTTASEEDLLTVVDYLAKNYGPRKNPQQSTSSVAAGADKSGENKK